MQGAATQAMPVRIVEERQRSRWPPAAAPLRAAARRPALLLARRIPLRVCTSLAPRQRAWGASSKMYTLFPDLP